MQSLLRAGALQAKLSIATVDDPAEREADAIADRVTAASRNPSALTAANQLQVFRSASGSAAPADIPAIVERAISSGGRAIDPGALAFFEARFGEDFSGVRIHADSEAARSAESIQAHAYTLGEDIAFAPGRYAPESGEGRRLLAHELAHVSQQRRSMPSASGAPNRRIWRQQAPTGVLTLPQSAPVSDATSWRDKVDAAVRAEFGLKGAGLTSKNVHFLDPEQFGKKFPGLEDALTYILWKYQYDDPRFRHILQIYTGRQFGLPPARGYSIEEVRGVVQEGIKDGYFWYHSLPTIDDEGVLKVTPRQLVSEYISGITEFSGPRSEHKINIQVQDEFAIETLVHETCHFYISDAFRDMVDRRKDKDDLMGGASISKILIEGFAEFFARQVMRSNPDLGPSTEMAYDSEVSQVVRFAETLGSASLEQAYFQGNAAAIKRLSAVVDQYKKISPDLLIP